MTIGGGVTGGPEHRHIVIDGVVYSQSATPGGPTEWRQTMLAPKFLEANPEIFRRV